MTVTLTASKTLTGTFVTDALRGGVTAGYDWGEMENGDDTPNEFDIFLSHDGAQKITNLAVNLQAYSGTYGGDYSAAADLAKILAHGDADKGLQLAVDWDAASLFASPTTFKTSIGDSFANRIAIPASAMSRNNTGTEVSPSSPVAGDLGASGDSARGDRAHLRARYLNPVGETATGYRQVDMYFSFNFTT